MLPARRPLKRKGRPWRTPDAVNFVQAISASEVPLCLELSVEQAWHSHQVRKQAMSWFLPVACRRWHRASSLATSAWSKANPGIRASRSFGSRHLPSSTSLRPDHPSHPFPPSTSGVLDTCLSKSQSAVSEAVRGRSHNDLDKLERLLKDSSHPQESAIAAAPPCPSRRAEPYGQTIFRTA